MNDPFPSQCMSQCILDETLAKNRKNLFIQHKRGDCQLPNGDSEDTEIPIDVNKFLALLIQYSTSPKGYSGVRVYFATIPDDQGPGIPTGRAGHLTLIAAATLESSFGTTKYEFDDPGSYYHLFDQCYGLDATTANGWINHFQTDRRPDLIDAGRIFTNTNGFVETSSLWYPMSTIKGSVISPTVGDIGMIGALQCGLGYTPNPITGMSAAYACFLQNENEPAKFPYFQLTVNFILHQKNDHGLGRRHLVLGSTSLRGLSDADTGLPCPPSNTCPPGSS